MTLFLLYNCISFYFSSFGNIELKQNKYVYINNYNLNLAIASTLHVQGNCLLTEVEKPYSLLTMK